MSKLKDVQVEESMGDWRAALRKWLSVLGQYREADKDDEAFWYNERATLSTLAGAIWLTGGLAFEEYRTQRGRAGEESRRGRADLWCIIGANRYTVEAKQSAKLSYPALASTLAKRAETQIQEAAKQCADDLHGAKTRIAMVFIVPSLLHQPNDDELNGWIAAVREFNADLKAYRFFKPSTQSSKDSRYYPGVVLLGRAVCAGANGNP